MRLVSFYLSFCVIGAALEWAYGKFWSLVGKVPWVYPDSVFGYTSLEVIPLWGFGALVCIAVFSAIMLGRAKYLLYCLPPLILAALWIVIYEVVTG